jgi:ankyrin repeat protein
MGGDALAKDASGGIPLHDAAAHGYGRTVRVLVEEMGGDVQAQAADGRTPLHYASFGGHAATVRMLVEMGSNVHARESVQLLAHRYMMLLLVGTLPQ